MIIMEELPIEEISTVSSLKCCKTKDSNYVCVNCHFIFHPSCLKRKPQVTFIEGHKIYCSKACKDDALSNKDILNKLSAQISGLRHEIEEREKLIIAEENKVTKLTKELLDKEK